MQRLRLVYGLRGFFGLAQSLSSSVELRWLISLLRSSNDDAGPFLRQFYSANLLKLITRSAGRLPERMRATPHAMGFSRTSYLPLTSRVSPVRASAVEALLELAVMKPAAVIQSRTHCIF
jgi:hypothetical protein